MYGFLLCLPGFAGVLRCEMALVAGRNRHVLCVACRNADPIRKFPGRIGSHGRGRDFFPMIPVGCAHDSAVASHNPANFVGNSRSREPIFLQRTLLRSPGAACISGALNDAAEEFAARQFFPMANLFGQEILPQHPISTGIHNFVH